MSDQNPFASWMKASQDWAKGISPEFAEVMSKSMQGFEDVMPTMPKDMMEQFMGKGINPDGLDVKTRLLLTLQGLVIQGAIAEPQIKLTVRHAIEAGATQIEITETIALAGMFGGGAGMPKALELAGEVFKKDETT